MTEIGKKKADIKNKNEADALVKKIKAADFAIDSITDKQRTKNATTTVYDQYLATSSIQSTWAFSVKKTMQLAQQLYEGLPMQDPSTPMALITYMRTDSLRLSDTALTQFADILPINLQKTICLPSQWCLKKQKVNQKPQAQDAHEAIRPIDVHVTPEIAAKYLPKDVARLYELIWKRCVASQMKPALYAQRQVVIKGQRSGI